jgi:hypothetical protein
MRPSSLPSGDHTVTPLYPTARPALLAAQTLLYLVRCHRGALGAIAHVAARWATC